MMQMNYTPQRKVIQISADQQRQSRDLTFKAQMIGLLSIVTFLFGSGIILGPLAIVLARKARKLNPEDNESDGAIVMGIIGFLASIAVPLSRIVFNI